MEKVDTNKLPSLNEIQEIISEIKNSDFSQVGYNKLFRKLQTLILIPFVTAKLNKGYHIERGRINNPDEVFTSEKEISYRTDYKNIVNYGRANIPHFSLFYGAIESDIIKHPRLVNLLETSEIFRNLKENNVDKADFVLTLGKWRITNEMEVVEIVFDKNSIKNSKDVKKSYEYHLKRLIEHYPEHSKHFKLILTFFSNQFAKKDIKTNFDYMVSAAYSDMAINIRNFVGVKYPSVKTDYQGHNIVLTPMAVENNLELEIAAMFRVLKNGMETIITPIAHATEFGNLNSEFKWIYK
jgi:hypothetical protein